MSVRTQVYSDKAASKQIMGRWDHQGDRENGKRRSVPRDQGLLFLSFTVHYLNKKDNSSTPVLRIFLSAHFLFWEIEPGVYRESEEEKGESKISPISIPFPLPPLPLEYLLSAGVVNNPTAKTRSIISFWPKQNQ